MRVIVDHDRCEAYGRCFAVAPALFDVDDDGYSVIDEITGPPEIGWLAASVSVVVGASTPCTSSRTPACVHTKSTGRASIKLSARKWR